MKSPRALQALLGLALTSHVALGAPQGSAPAPSTSAGISSAPPTSSIVPAPVSSQASGATQTPAPSGTSATTGSFGGGNGTNSALPTNSGFPQVTRTTTCPPHSTSNMYTVNLESSTLYWDLLCLPTSYPPIWNLKNTTCDKFNYQKPEDQWNSVDGDMVVNNLTTTFEFNLGICPYCLGQDLADCPQANPDDPSYNEDCKLGLNDLANGRWDTAAARFAHDTGLDDLQCNIQQGECSAAPSCQDCNGPGTYAILKSLETLNNIFNNIYNAIGDARDQCMTQMTQFSKDFAPVPNTDSDTAFLAVFNAIALTFGGLIAPEAALANVAIVFTSVTANGVLSQLTAATPKQPADTSQFLGVIANTTQTAYADIADKLFRQGNATWDKAPDGSTGVNMSQVMSGGQLMAQNSDPNSIYKNLLPLYQRSMYQQLAVYTWQHLEIKDTNTDSSVNIPFIAFDNGPCNAVTTDLSKTIPGVDGPNTHVDFDGNCYYLLDAKVALKPPTPGPYSEAGSDIPYCSGSNTLPGGSNDFLTGDSSHYAGLTLGDFVIPSVKGWKGNGNQNGYPAAGGDGKLINDLQEPGVTTLPVCDYNGNADAPGKGCPVIGTKNHDCQVY